MSLDNRINYSEDKPPSQSLLLITFNRPLTREEHYNLCKLLYPATYVHTTTSSEWRLARAFDEGINGVYETDMILVEKPPNQESLYHWSFARNWQTDQLWAYDEGMMPEV